MKRHGWSTGLVAVLSVFLSVSASAGSGVPVSEDDVENPVPRLKLPKPVHDFGKLPANTKTDCVFPIRNEGTAPLVISRVLATCGCTAADLEDKELAPGAETELRVTFTAGSMVGKIKKYVTLSTNDPKAKTAKVEVRGEVIPRVISNPKMLRFGEVPLGEGRTLELEMRRGEQEPVWNSVRLATRIPTLTIEPLPRTEDDGDRWMYRVTLKKDAPRGRIFGYVEVFVNDETKPAARLTVSATVQGRIKVTPLIVSLYTRGPNSPATARVVLSHRADERFNIVDVRCDVPHIVWELDTMEGQARYEMRLRLEDDAPLGRLLRGDIVVTTDDPHERQIRVRVSAQRRQASTPGRLSPPTRRITTGNQTRTSK